MNWIDIREIDKIQPKGNILIWQHNLNDEECSRFQRAIHYKESHIDIYPLTHRTTFDFNENGFYEGYDLEGDLCRVTHFALIEAPSKP
jgi:hypothetical protein